MGGVLAAGDLWGERITLRREGCADRVVGGVEVGCCLGVALSPCGAWVVACGVNGMVQAAVAGPERRVLSTTATYQVKVTPAWIVSCGASGVHLRALSSGAYLRWLARYATRCLSVHTTQVAAAGVNHLRVWNAGEEGRLVAKVASKSLQCLVFVPSGGAVVASGLGEELYVWDLLPGVRGGAVLARTLCVGRRIVGVDVSPCGGWLAVLSDRCVTVHALKGKEEEEEEEGVVGCEKESTRAIAGGWEAGCDVVFVSKGAGCVQLCFTCGGKVEVRSLSLG